jgi:hypothetical protein
MSTIINADTSNGLKLTSDTSGIIQLQSGGTTKATVNSSGLTSPGHILQVINGVKTGSFTTTSTSFVDTGLTASITPSATSSKIAVLVGCNAGHNAAAASMALKLMRDATDLNLWLCESGTYISPTVFANEIGYHLNYLDSPATTSAVTYKIQIKAPNANTVYFSSGTYTTSSIMLMEVAV